MEEDGCSPNGCSYNVIIRGFLQHKNAESAAKFIHKMRDRGFSAEPPQKPWWWIFYLINDDNLVKYPGFREGCQAEKVM
jgi:pentatricopeptide repeat protein